MPAELRELMHETADLDFAPPDLGAITRAGDKVVRRRRTLAGVAGLAAAAVIGGGVWAIAPGGGGDAPVAVDGTGAVEPTDVTWARDSVLHSPDGTVDIGHDIRAYARTDAGFVIVDPDGVVFSYRAGGSANPIGQLDPDTTKLVADTRAGRVAWLSADRSTVVVWDVAADVEYMRVDVTSLDAPEVIALHAHTLYLRDGSGYAVGYLRTGELAPFEAGEDGVRLLTAGGGLYVFYDEKQSNGGGMVGPSYAEAKHLAGAWGAEQVRLSPDGRYVSFDADEPTIFRTDNAERVELDVDGRYFATGYEWLDADTVVMIASRSEGDPAELLSCSASAGRCKVVVPELGTFDELEDGFALPVGEPLG